MSDSNRLHIAQHEAAHAVAAQAMGLRVAWVDITGGYAAGEFFMAAVGVEVEGDEADHNGLAMNATNLDPDQLRGVCISMVTPSFIASHSATWLGRYSQIEAQYAYRMADNAGIDREEIDAHAEEILDGCWQEIAALANKLVAEGRVEFAVIA